MSRLLRAGLLALALPAIYGAMTLLAPAPSDAALLALKPGPIDHPLHLIGADFNQDGYDDLAIANFEAGTVTVLINQKDGTFAPQKDSPNIVGGATVGQPSLDPVYLAVGDLNPEDVDGDRVNNEVDDCPNIYNPVDTTTGLQPDSDSNGVGDACQSTTVIDSDGDGVPDYAAGVLDNCPFTYNPGQEPATAKGLDGACGTSDDNPWLFGSNGSCGDGDDLISTKVGAVCAHSNDLITVLNNSGGGSSLGLVRVRVNDGTGGLLNRFSLQAGFGASRAVLADFNGDHHLDAVVSNSGGDVLLFFPGANEGDMGLVCLGGTNAGNACSSAAACPGGTCQQTITLLTGATCSGGTLSGQSCVTSSNCPGGTCRAPTPPGAVAVCIGGSEAGTTCRQDRDCQGGGLCRSGAVCFGGIGNGQTCTSDSQCLGGGLCRAPSAPVGLATADFNGDGLPDLAYADQSAENVGILLDAGAAAFSPAPGSPFAVPNQPVDVLAGALDGDACADLVVLSEGTLACVNGSIPGSACRTDQDCVGGGACQASRGEVRVFKTTCPTGPLVATQTIDLGTGHVPRGGSLVDFDHDGHLDLAVVDFSGGQVLVYAGTGSGTFSLPPVTLAGFANPSALAPLDYDHDTFQDLAVLGYSDNRVSLYRNTSTPGSLSFSPAPTSPVSPWKNVTAMALFPADASVGLDVALLNATPPRLDVLSGTGSTFRGLPPESIPGPAAATGMTIGDLLQDGNDDLLVLDSTTGTATPMISQANGAQSPRPSVPAGSGPTQAFVAPLSLHRGDYDQDGVPDAIDDCPTRYNPPSCPANDETNFPQCFVDIPCKDTSPGKAPVDCAAKDPLTGQCDSDLNGVGDQCQILDANCQNIDTDFDLVFDYDQNTTPAKLDNCPWESNPTQTDIDSNGIGDFCDSSTCFLTGTTGTCVAGPREGEVCRSDKDCDAFVNDAVVVDQSGGALSFLVGDASGSFRPAPSTWTSVGGLSRPVGAVVGRFAYTCSGPTCFLGSNAGKPCFGPADCPGGVCASLPLTCNSNSEPAIMFAEQGAPGSGDDSLNLLVGDGTGGFAPPVSPVAAQIPLQGDPAELLMADDQGVCDNPWVSTTDTRFHFDDDGKTSVLAAIEPGTSSVQIILPSNDGPVAPPGLPGPLPLAVPPVDATFVDLNRDGYQDLVVLSSGGAGNPATPNITIYMGVGSGLFFTDPSINPTDVPDGMSFLAAGNINLSVDSTYPDVVLFDSVAHAPIIMTNTLRERADVDRSGRVDGYDLALLARSFGATRGEDFTIRPDGTLLQSPDLGSSPAYMPTRVVVGSGVLNPGMNLPIPTGTVGALFCDNTLQPLTGLYGLPVDINLDGVVDGLDLALLASKFGTHIP